MHKEEFTSLLKGNPSEKIPVFLFDYTLGMEAAGYGTSQVFIPHFDGVKMGRSILALRHILGHDAAIGCPIAFDLRLFGGEMCYKDDATPTTSRCAFADPSRLYDCDMGNAASISKEQMKAYELIRKEEADFPIGCPISSPYSMGCQLRGYESFLMDTMLEPDYIKDLTSFTADYFRETSSVIMGSGNADFMMLSSSFDTFEVFGSEYYLKNVIPTFRTFINHGRSFGIPTAMHPHGCFTDGCGRKILSEIIGTGVNSLYFGENNDMRILSEICRDRVSLIGGIDSFTTIYLGNEERIKDDVNRCIEIFRNNAHALSCSCSVERFLPLDKMKIMTDAVRSINKKE